MLKNPKNLLSLWQIKTLQYCRIDEQCIICNSDLIPRLEAKTLIAISRQRNNRKTNFSSWDHTTIQTKRGGTCVLKHNAIS